MIINSYKLKTFFHSYLVSFPKKNNNILFKKSSFYRIGKDEVTESIIKYHLTHEEEISKKIKEKDVEQLEYLKKLEEEKQNSEITQEEYNSLLNKLAEETYDKVEKVKLFI